MLTVLSLAQGYGATINDGIPDAWRAQFFGADFATLPQAAAIADPDGDGACNYQEFLAGTDPTQASSVEHLPQAILTFAGSTAGSQDGPALLAQFDTPYMIRKDPQGHLWVVESSTTGFWSSRVGGHRIRKISPSGVVTTVAGAAEYGYVDGPALQARFRGPADLVFDRHGNAFVCDMQNSRIRKIGTNGVVTTFAGAQSGFRDGTGTNALFDLPIQLEVDAEDNLYVADFNNYRIRKITPEGVVTTFAGSSGGSANGDRLAATFNSPNGLAFAPDGSLLVSDWSNGAVRKIATNGMVTTLVAGLGYTEMVSVDAQGNYYASYNAGSGTACRQYSAAGTLLWTFNRSGGLADGPLDQARYLSLTRYTLMADGSLLSTDPMNHRIRKIVTGPRPLVVFNPAGTGFSNRLEVTLSTPITNGVIRFTLDGSLPTPTAAAFSNSLEMLRSGLIKAAVFVNDLQVSPVAEQSYLRLDEMPPVLPSEPLTLVAAQGAPFTLSANAAGSGPLYYQWQFNGTNLDGMTGATLTVPAAQTEDSGAYAVTVSNAFGVASGVIANVTVQPQPPFIVMQPASQSVVAGAPATFAVSASGTPPLTYQWHFDGQPIPDATNATFGIAAAQDAHAGTYQVAVSNALGGVLSAGATLSVTHPPARMVLPSLITPSGRTVTVPVLLVANGNENALQFSVQFSVSRLTLIRVEAGAAAGEAVFLANTNSAASGRVGIALSLPAEKTFTFGTQEVAQLVFQTALQTANYTTSLSFYDSPTARQISDIQARSLPASYNTGSIQLLAADYEGDVTPRGSADRRVTVTDWVQVGRFVAALDTPAAGGEFQRADCAPRAEGGNGILSATDWVQAGRYAVGLDAAMAADGPTNFLAAPTLVRTASIPRDGTGGNCVVTVADSLVVAGETNWFHLTINAAGNESALTFTLRFDPSQLSFVEGAVANASLRPSLNLNTNQLAAGKLGVALTLPTETTFTAGAQTVVNLGFRAVPTAQGPITLDFDNTLVAREVADVQANAVAAAWQGKALRVALPTPGMLLKETRHALTFRWPAALGEAVLEATDDLTQSWLPVEAARIEAGGQIEVELPLDGARKFYRLRRQ